MRQKTGIIIQARLGSTRFPRKVIEPFAGSTVLERIYKACSEVYCTIVACPGNEPELIEWLYENGITVSPGNATDVLLRYIQAANHKDEKLTHVIRITGDCPLVSQETIYWIGEHGLSGGYDFYSNCGEGRKAYDGNDVEFISVDLLNYVDKEIVGHPKEAYYREHVTPRMYEPLPDRFKVGLWRGNGPNLSDMKYSIDTPKDLEHCEASI